MEKKPPHPNSTYTKWIKLLYFNHRPNNLVRVHRSSIALEIGFPLLPKKKTLWKDLVFLEKISFSRSKLKDWTVKWNLCGEYVPNCLTQIIMEYAFPSPDLTICRAICSFNIHNRSIITELSISSIGWFPERYHLIEFEQMNIIINHYVNEDEQKLFFWFANKDQIKSLFYDPLLYVLLAEEILTMGWDELNNYLLEKYGQTMPAGTAKVEFSK